MVPECKRPDLKYIWRSSFNIAKFEKHVNNESLSDTPDLLKHGMFNFSMSKNSTKHEILSLSPRRHNNINNPTIDNEKSPVQLLKKMRSLSTPLINKPAKHEIMAEK